MGLAQFRPVAPTWAGQCLRMVFSAYKASRRRGLRSDWYLGPSTWIFPGARILHFESNPRPDVSSLQRLFMLTAASVVFPEIRRCSSSSEWALVIDHSANSHGCAAMSVPGTLIPGWFPKQPGILTATRRSISTGAFFFSNAALLKTVAVMSLLELVKKKSSKAPKKQNTNNKTQKHPQKQANKKQTKGAKVTNVTWNNTVKRTANQLLVLPHCTQLFFSHTFQCQHSH